MPDWSAIKVGRPTTTQSKLDWATVGVKKAEPVVKDIKPGVNPEMDWRQIRSPDSPSMDTNELTKAIPIQDIAQISSVVPPVSDIEPEYLKPSTALAAGMATPYAKIVEGPAWRLTSNIIQGVSGSIKGFGSLIDKVLPNEAAKATRNRTTKWLDKAADYYGNPEKYAPVGKHISDARKTFRAASAQKGTASLLLNDLGAATTDLAGLIAQFQLMGMASPGVSPFADTTPLAQMSQHLAKIGIHGMLTGRGTVQDRVESSTYRIAYNITPYIANATGATGLAAVTVDSLLNMFLTSPTYKRAFDEAEGLNKEFMVMALPQFVMDVGMALNTRGMPENQMRARIRQYNKGRTDSLKMPEGELLRMVKDMQGKQQLDSGKSGRELGIELSKTKKKLVEEGVRVINEDRAIFGGAEVREAATPTLESASPKTPPVKPPVAAPTSPGFRPDEGPPTRYGLSDPSAVTKAANEMYKIIDVEARFKAVGAPDTGFNVKNYFSMRGTMESLAHHLVGKMTKDFKFTSSEWADLTYYSSQYSLMKDLDSKRYPIFTKAARQVNEAFLKVERMLEKTGIIIDPWPQSQIKRLREDIIHERELLSTVSKSAMPPQLKEYRLKKLKADMDEAKGAINFLEKEDIQFVHIPTRLWLNRLMKDDPTRARTVMNQYFKERKTINIKDLAESLKKQGIIKDEDIDVRNILAAYYQQAGHKLALSNIMNAATKEGLIVDADKQKDWPLFNPRWAPDLKGKRIHPAFRQFVEEFTLKSESVPLHRVLSYFKMTQFDSPLFMPFYDLYQAFWLGSVRSIKTPVYAWKAFKSMLNKDESYLKLAENGLFSRPFVAPFESFMRDIEQAKSTNFVKQVTTFLKGEWQGVKEAHPLVKPFRIAAIPIDAIYKPIWHTAWGGDQLIRLISGHYLLDKGYTNREAAQVAARFHADYASVPPKVKNTLNKIFFTPVFPIAMAKLQTEMIYQSGKLLTDAVKLKAPDRRTKAMVGGLLGLAGLAVMQDIILTQLGYERDTFGYKYTKQVVDENGNEKELVISTPNPGNVLLRYGKTFENWPTTPEEASRYALRVAWRLQPVWRLGIMLTANLREDGKTPIYNLWGDPANIAKDIISFGASQLVRIIGRINELPQSKSDKRAAWEALQEDVGQLWTGFLKISTQVYLRNTKDSRKRGKMIGLMKSFTNFISKKPLGEEEMDRAMGRFERELRAVTETE